jgi:transcriptional regulator with XRE-family HTH domain
MAERSSWTSALGLGVRELAAAAKVSTDTVARFERGDELKERTIDALQRALEAAGIEFTNGDQPGVRLTKAAAARSAKPVSASKHDGCGESSPRQNRQGDREETISVAPSVPAALASRKGRTGTRMIRVSASAENTVSTVSIVSAARSHGSRGDQAVLNGVRE